MKELDASRQNTNVLDDLDDARVAPLSQSDIAAVRAVEQVAYGDAPDLVTDTTSSSARFAEFEAGRAQLGAPNLCLKYENDGRILGYVIAGESEYTKKDGTLPPGTRYIHVADFAVSDKNSLAGGRVALTLVKRFLSLYKSAYVDNGTQTPIVFISRETTSRRLLHSMLPVLQSDHGMAFTMTEDAFTVGNDKMYQTVLTLNSSAAPKT